MKFTEYIGDVLPAFQFLIDDYSFALTEKEVANHGTYLVYKNPGLNYSIYLKYEYRGTFSYFFHNGTKKLSFWEFFNRHETVAAEEVFPVGDYKEALLRNTELLKKHGHGVLTGKEEL